MPETRARDLANLAGAGATSSTVAYHETARGFTLPAGTGEANQVISSDGDGTTTWKNTLSAPEITSVTSDKGVNAYDSDGDDGAVIVINGTNFGNDPSVLTAEISTDNFVTTVQTSTISILSDGTQIQATFNGTETNYNSINAGETVKVKVTKSNLQSAQSATLSGTVTGDPTFGTTSTTASTHTGTLASTSLGSYGGSVAGGGQDSNTKLLLNFDRAGGTDIEDSSNTGGDGHKITASGNAIIKASPFGDGKSAIRFDAVDGTEVKVASFNTGTGLGAGAFTLEAWVWCEEHNSDSANPIIIDTRTGSNGFGLEMVKTSGQLFIWDGVANSKIITESANTLLPLKTWTHVAIVRTATGTPVKLYLNGKEAGASGNNSSNYSSETLTFGRAYNANGSNFKGYQDEIRVVVGTAVYTGNFDVPTSRFSASDEANTKLLIHSDSALHTTNLGTHLIPKQGAGLTDEAPSASVAGENFTKSIRFEKGNSSATHAWLEIKGFDPSVWNSAWTIEGWVNLINDNYGNSGTSSAHGLFSTKDLALGMMISGSGDTSNGYTHIGAWAGNGSSWSIMNAQGPEAITTGTSGGASNWATGHGQWFYVVYQFTGSAYQVFTNGTRIINVSNSNTIYNTDYLYIGRWGYNYLNNHDFYGRIKGFHFSKTARYSGTTHTVPTSLPTQDSNTVAIIRGDEFHFTDSSSSEHPISPTGAGHDQNHGGIPPAMAWPSSLKKTGSAGVYFDGTGDYLSIPTSTDFHIALDTSAYHFGTIEAYIYPTFSSGTGAIISSTHSSSQSSNYWSLKLVNGYLEWEVRGAGTLDITHSDTVIPTSTWTHVAVTRTHSGSTATYKIYVNGTEKGTGTSTSFASFAGSVLIGANNTGSVGEYFQGYIDHLRFRLGSTSSATVTPTASTLPTKIYGAYRSQDVGTIQLNATAGTGGGALDYAELSGGTALSTYGLSLNPSTGAITGTLTGLNDNSNSGGVIRIRARANTDDNRVTTLGGASFTGITQNDGKTPVLFNARRYVGTGATRNINGFGFAPDLVWIKNRDAIKHHRIVDSVRGASQHLISNESNAESTQTAMVTALNSDGFSVGSSDNVNSDAQGMIAWTWKAGGAPSGNGKKIVDGVESPISAGTSGDFYRVSNVSQSVNTAGQFSITKYDGSADSSSTTFFKHGLNGKPDFFVIKRLTSPANTWLAWHKDLTSTEYAVGASNWIYLDSNHPRGSHYGTPQTWTYIRDITTENISPYDDFSTVNTVNATYICYAWRAVAGVSAFGTYEGDGTTSNVVSLSNISPRLLIIKNIDGTGPWMMTDTFRGGSLALEADDSKAEASGGVTLGTNQFTVTSSGSYWNTNGSTYIYMAFA